MSIFLIQNNKSLEPILRVASNTDWLIIIFLILLVLYIIVERLFPGYMYSVIGKGLIFKPVSFYIKSWKLRRKYSLYILTAASIINIGLLLLYSSKFLNISIVSANEILRFLSFIFMITFYGIIKIGIYRLSGILFDIQEIIKEYIANKYLQLQIYGIILFPISCLIPFVNEKYVKTLIVFAFILLIIIHIISILRIISVFTARKFSKFYMILYLCALEILPVMLLGKLFDSLI